MSLFVFDLDALDTEATCTVLALLQDAGHDVEVWTRRPKADFGELKSILADRGVSPTLLTRMRAPGDERSEADLKRAWASEYIDEPLYAVFDESTAGEIVWSALGITCFRSTPAAPGWSFNLSEAINGREYLLACAVNDNITVILARLHWFEDGKNADSRSEAWQETLTGVRITWATPYAFAERLDPPDVGSAP